MEKKDTITNSLIIAKVFDKHNIRQREKDGYLSATDMCKAFGKLFADYNRLTSTVDYMAAVLNDMGIPISELVQTRKGGIPTEQGTWVHPLIATHLAQWLSPKFSLQVNKWVLRYLSGDPTLVKDVVDNHDKIHKVKTTQINFSEDKERAELEERRANIEKIKAETEKMRLETAMGYRKLEADTVMACTPLLAQVEQFKGDAHIYSAVKSYIVNTMTFNTRVLPDPAANAENILLNKDISQIIRDNHWRLPDNTVLCKIGKAISQEYYRRYNRKPLTANKHVNGSIRAVKVYAPVDLPWITEIINRELNGN
jgi:hypothetical protein